jgi:hypothetical protein
MPSVSGHRWLPLEVSLLLMQEVFVILAVLMSEALHVATLLGIVAFCYSIID